MSVQSFIKLPKALFTDSALSALPSDAKLLYCLMLDRLCLSKKNGWHDKYNRLYIIYAVKSMCSDLNCGKNKVIKILKILEGAGLIRRVKRYRNKTDLIYVTDIIKVTQEDTDKDKGADKDNSAYDNGNTQGGDVDNCGGEPLKNDSGGVKNTPVEVSKEEPNKTEKNKTECVFVDRYIDRTHKDIHIDIKTVINKVKEQIDYDGLCADAQRANHGNKRLQKHFVSGLDELVESIADVYFLSDDSKPMNIGGKIYPVEYVKHRYSKLDYITVDYILGCMRKTKSRIRNIKKYMTAVLFNASSTVESYFKAETNADLAQWTPLYKKLTQLNAVGTYA